MKLSIIKTIFGTDILKVDIFFCLFFSSFNLLNSLTTMIIIYIYIKGSNKNKL